MRPPFTLATIALLLAAGPAEAAKPRIAMIPKGTTHVFWKTIEAASRSRSWSRS